MGKIIYTYNIIIRIACAPGETGTVQQSIVSYRPLIVRVHASPGFSFALYLESTLPVHVMYLYVHYLYDVHIFCSLY